MRSERCSLGDVSRDDGALSFGCEIIVGDIATINIQFKTHCKLLESTTRPRHATGSRDGEKTLWDGKATA